MVTSPSSATQQGDHEKRRKSSSHPAAYKIDHLSEQLQLRLRYARLKVENGWTKQSLNEVENLYFHGKSKAPRPFATPAPTYMAATTYTHPAPFAATPSAPAQSSLSFKLGTSNLIRPSNTFPSLPESSANANSSSSGSISTAPLNASSSLPSLPVAPSLAQPTVVATPSLPSEAPTASSSGSGPKIIEIPPAVLPARPVTPATASPALPNVVSPPNIQSSSHPHQPQTTTDYYPAVKPPRPRAQRLPVGPKGSHQNLSVKDMTQFSTSSPLTYDSFWSSHSGSTVNRSPLKTSLPTLAFADIGPAFSSAIANYHTPNTVAQDQTRPPATS